MDTACKCCKKGLPESLPCVCPECGHVFQGSGWDGIDAHWKARHESVMPYRDFWATLCAKHIQRDGVAAGSRVPVVKSPAVDQERVLSLLARAKKLAQQYRQLTGKPLGITGEVAEYEAARLLGRTLTPARNAGYDAIEGERSLQIKGRCIFDSSKRGQRLGSLQPDKQWDAVLMVLLDANFNATEIWEADRAPALAALAAPGSRARNERGRAGCGQDEEDRAPQMAEADHESS